MGLIKNAAHAERVFQHQLQLIQREHRVRVELPAIVHALGLAAEANRQGKMPTTSEQIKILRAFNDAQRLLRYVQKEGV